MQLAAATKTGRQRCQAMAGNLATMPVNKAQEQCKHAAVERGFCSRHIRRWDRTRCHHETCICHDDTARPYACGQCGCTWQGGRYW